MAMRQLITLVLIALALLPSATTSATPAARGVERFAVAGQIIFIPIFDDQGAIKYQVLTPLKDNTKCLVSILANESFTGPPEGVTPTESYLEGEGLVFLEVRIDRPCYPETLPGSSSERGQVHGSISGALKSKDGAVLKTGTFNFLHTFTVDNAGNFRGKTEILAGTGELEGLRGVLFTASSGTDPDSYTGRVTLGK